ncbi:DUF1127 domain-containing protein [Fluviibacterium sp. DFM31]|uniref:DUF1127 domain-containing protein n=1 Tax=Meridianimarinicoccus marinus TaxID=3231483 RepID=A0ABV3L0Z9_9RHOB
MAYVHAHALPQATGSVFSLPAQLLTRFRAWTQTRQTRNALMKLSARELADVGLTYADIEKVARKTVNV